VSPVVPNGCAAMGATGEIKGTTYLLYVPVGASWHIWTSDYSATNGGCRVVLEDF